MYIDKNEAKRIGLLIGHERWTNLKFTFFLSDHLKTLNQSIKDHLRIP